MIGIGVLLGQFGRRHGDGAVFGGRQRVRGGGHGVHIRNRQAGARAPVSAVDLPLVASLPVNVAVSAL